MMNQGGYDGDGGSGGDDGFDYYSNSGIYNSNHEYFQQQQQQQHQQQQQYYYEEDSTTQQQQYYDDSQYYEEVDASHLANQKQQQFDDYYYANNNNSNSEASSFFYPLRAPLVVHPNGTQDDYGNYDTRGDAISAIAITTFDNDDDIGEKNVSQSSLMYVASHSTNHGGKGGHEQSRVVGGLAGRRNTTNTSTANTSLHRGSRMTVMYDPINNVIDSDNNPQIINPIMYSSFVGHPEAKSDVLDGLHSVLFGSGIDIVAPSLPSSSAAAAVTTSAISTIRSSSTMKARPSHAYGPPFGPPSFVHQYHPTTSLLNNAASVVNKRPEERHTMGISSIFEISTPYLGSGGRICSISPYGVRVHTRGGMIMSDSNSRNRSSSQQQQHGSLLSGMTCGALMESGDLHFAVVGGMSSFDETGGSSVGSTTTATRSSQHIHCVDLHRDLKIVSSHTLIPNNNNGDRGQQQKRMCVSDMAFHNERNSIVVGCSDGTIRVLDGGRRNVEVAKAKAQLGGVANVAVWEVSSGH